MLNKSIAPSYGAFIVELLSAAHMLLIVYPNTLCPCDDQSYSRDRLIPISSITFLFIYRTDYLFKFFYVGFIFIKEVFLRIIPTHALLIADGVTPTVCAYWNRSGYSTTCLFNSDKFILVGCFPYCERTTEFD